MEAANSDAQNSVCVCCFEAMGEIRARPTKCDHFFHPDCLRKWALLREEEMYEMICPLCLIPSKLIVVEKNGENGKTTSIENTFEMRQQLDTVCYKCLVRDNGPLVICGWCTFNYHDKCPLMEKKNLKVMYIDYSICQTCNDLLAENPALRNCLAIQFASSSNQANNADPDLDFEDGTGA